MEFQKQVADFIISLEMSLPEKAKIVNEITNLFILEKSDLTVEIKYGGIVFIKDDSLIGGVFLSKKHISIEFSNGSKFDDIQEVLEGSGKFRRHIKISNYEDLNIKNVTAYIRQAID